MTIASLFSRREGHGKPDHRVVEGMFKSAKALFHSVLNVHWSICSCLNIMVVDMHKSTSIKIDKANEAKRLLKNIRAVSYQVHDAAVIVVSSSACACGGIVWPWWYRFKLLK